MSLDVLTQNKIRSLDNMIQMEKINTSGSLQMTFGTLAVK